MKNAKEVQVILTTRQDLRLCVSSVIRREYQPALARVSQLNQTSYGTASAIFTRTGNRVQKIFGGIQEMTPFKTQAYIQSLNQGLMKPTHKDEITVLEKVGDNDYIVDYKDVRCHALFNWFAGAYFANDVYGIVKPEEV